LWRDHVMVVAHRGGGVEAARSIHPENSVAAVRSMIEAGVEMIEIDVQKTRDGVFVVFHDSWLDRSSTCRGVLAERSIAELASCRLVVEATRKPTEETIPSLRDLLAVTKNRIFVNI